MLIENAIFQLPDEMSHFEGSMMVDVIFQLSEVSMLSSFQVSFVYKWYLKTDEQNGTCINSCKNAVVGKLTIKSLSILVS